MDTPSDDKSRTSVSSTTSDVEPSNTPQYHQRKWTPSITNLLPLWLRGSATILAPTIQDSQRKQYISTNSHPLTGTYPLLDLLRVTSQSGRINITIGPQPSDPAVPAPAELRISSLSGSIGVNVPFFNVPEREYITAIDSTSGAIDARIIHGVTTRVESLSGSLSLRLVMVGKGASSLSTSCKSGRTEVSLAAGSSEVVIEDMKSEHRTLSGIMVLRYPKEWEGTIEGRSTGGSMNLHGPGVTIVRQSPHEVVARKGDGGSRMEVKTMSGSVDVYFE